MEQRIRVASVIVTLGLIIALVSLVVNHPVAFVAFLGFGVLLITIGILMYLIALLRGGTHVPPTPAAE